MQTAVDAQLLDEAERYRLRFACADCAHHDPTSGRCAEGYPPDATPAPALAAVATLRFCKLFELV